MSSSVELIRLLVRRQVPAVRMIAWRACGMFSARTSAMRRKSGMSFSPAMTSVGARISERRLASRGDSRTGRAPSRMSGRLEVEQDLAHRVELLRVVAARRRRTGAGARLCRWRLRGPSDRTASMNC